ncbi:MAG: hypothetical protein ACE5JX_03240 [Acidobacteriota bacterium]
MKFELKPVSHESMQRSLDRAERYRLLNEPEQAESICRDILRLEPGNRKAAIGLLLALTDQFRRRLGHGVKAARAALSLLDDPYERAYYAGIICERRARAKLDQEVPGSGFVAYHSFREAMEWYEKAEKIRPSGNDDTLLRWNSCARTIMDRSLKARPEDDFVPLLE